MRIISKFHDYYDSALAHGLDPTRLYSRVAESRTIDARCWPGSRAVLPLPLRHTWGLEPAVRSLTLGFCGQHFPLWVDSSWKFEVEQLTGHDKERHWLSVLEAVEAHEKWLRERVGPSRSLASYLERDRRQWIQHEHKIRQTPTRSETFRAFGCPVYVLAASGGGYRQTTQVHVITNPRLANLGFERVVDTFSAFQTIATFLDNELATTESCPDTVGGDEVVARSKGFDEQSFRTAAPGQKKLNRKENRERKRTRGV